MLGLNSLQSTPEILKVVTPIYLTKYKLHTDFLLSTSSVLNHALLPSIEQCVAFEDRHEQCARALPFTPPGTEM